MKISIVIPAYNEEKYIGRTLESIKQLDTNGWDVEVLVIDGSSTDKTAEVAKSYGARTKSVPHKTIGFSRQEGIKEAKGEIIIFTDADTILPSDWITRHVAILQRPGVVCSCGGFRLADGTFPFYHISNYMQPISLWILYKLFYIPIATGQNLAFWKNKALEIGGIDEELALWEDVDLAMRMRRVGKVNYDFTLLIDASGRRSQEGWGFVTRMAKTFFQYFVLGPKSLGGFPDFR